MKKNHDKAIITLPAIPTVNDERTRIMFKKHERYYYKVRPHKVDDNWLHSYYIPWVCFLEFAIMILYLLFGYMQQRTTIDFALDHSKAIDNYFLTDYDFEINDNSDVEDQVFIFFKSKFLHIINETGYRFLSFENDFPCSDTFTSNGFISVEVKYKETTTSYIYDQVNMSQFRPMVESLSSNFDVISLNSVYHIKTQNSINSVDLAIVSKFTNDHNTKIITLDLHHSQIPHIDLYRWKNFLENPLITIPLIIIIFAVIVIVLELISTRSVYVYSHDKALTNFLKPLDVFKKKFDKWTIYSFFCHILSIISCILYVVDRSNFNGSIPVTMIFLALATFFNSFLLIRYVKMKSYTMVVVNVIARAAVKIAAFLIGCVAIFIAYLILGCSFFGPYNLTFRTFIDGAECLIAVVHGDSIKYMFDTSDKRPTINEWYGITYWFVWIFFSLTIMFNISISIFQEVLLSEIDQHDKEQLKIKRRNEPNDQYTLILPVNMKRTF